MMNAQGCLICDQGGEQMPIGSRSGIGIDDGKKILALAGAISYPCEQVMPRLRFWLLRRWESHNQAKDDCHNGKDTQHDFSSVM
jgi:hypothetical protein